MRGTAGQTGLTVVFATIKCPTKLSHFWDERDSWDGELRAQALARSRHSAEDKLMLALRTLQPDSLNLVIRHSAKMGTPAKSLKHPQILEPVKGLEPPTCCVPRGKSRQMGGGAASKAIDAAREGNTGLKRTSPRRRPATGTNARCGTGRKKAASWNGRSLEASRCRGLGPSFS